MNKSKKLFNSEDFDKKKPLFESEDFDKPMVGNKEGEQKSESDSSSHPGEKSSKAKIIGGIVAAAVIIAGGIFFANNDKADGNNKTAAEATTQEGEDHDASNHASTTEPKDNAEAASPDMVEGKAANEANSESSVADYSHVTTSAEKSPMPTSEKSDKPADGDVETNAHRVIRGEFGNGQVRKDRLGNSYSEIQSRVNEMYRQGLAR